MRRSLVLVLVLCFATMGWAYPSKNKKQGSEKSLQLKQGMQRLETNYFNLAILANSKNLDFDKVKFALDDMEAVARKIRALKVKGELDQPLKDLSVQVGQLKKEISQEDPIHLRKGVDQLYESCFRCHAMNNPTQK